MKKLGEFLKKSKNFHSQGIIIREMIADTIEKQTGIKVLLGEISIKSGIITIQNINSSAKSVIFIKKQQIIQEINEKQKTKIIKDIR